jgi:predicted nucleic acid-binding protein
MPLLLDTNVVSAARRPERQAERFRAFFADFDASTAFLSAITIMEIEFGISREQKRDTVFAAELDHWFRGIVLPRFQGRILTFDADAASIAGKLPTADKRPSPDAMIAAIALHHGMDVVTRNTAHFEPLGVRCLNPWV